MSRSRPDAPHGAPGNTTVLATVTVGLADFIARQGGDPESVFGRAGLRADLYEQPNAPISLHSFCLVLDEAVRRTGNDNFGLWFGQQFTPEALGLLGYLAASSATLARALDNMVEHFPMHQQNSLLRMSQDQGLCRLEYKVHDGSILNRRQDAEVSLGMFSNIMRRALGPAWSPLEIQFEHARPEAWQEHRRAFRSDIRFERAANAIVFRAADLVRPMPGADDRLLAIVRQSLRSLDLQPRTPLRLADRVKAEILALLPRGEPRLDPVAERLKLPAWTLQRRLSEEGHSFMGLLEAVRKELACARLMDGRTSISELALRLGYTEVSTFSRAFFRWFGASPRDWRRAALAD